MSFIGYISLLSVEMLDSNKRAAPRTALSVKPRAAERIRFAKLLVALLIRQIFLCNVECTS